MKIPYSIFLSAVLGAGLIAVTDSSHAATLTVTSNADSGAGTLRNALTNAVNGDTIIFSITGTITLTNGELLVISNVTILGPGPASLAVNGNANSRVFHVQSGSNATTIAGLTITNGSGAGTLGGGIYNDHSILTVSNCTLSGNTARFGGSIYNDGRGGSATLSLIGSTINTNSAGIAGAGIFNDGIGGNATLTVSNSTFSGNATASNGNGAGIYNDGESSGHALLSVNASTFTGNAAYFGSGGGINNDAGTVTVSNSTFTGNLAYTPGGGGIYSAGTLTVNASTFSGNSAGSGGGIYGIGTWTVSTTTLSGNSASVDGGGIINDGSFGGSATGLVASCTFSTNTAGSGGGIYNYGAGSSNTTLRVNASTFSGNSASGGGGAFFNDGSSAGQATLEIGDTILIRGTAGSNFTNILGTVISHGYNLASDGGGGFLTATGDLIHTNAMLGPLQNNGGPALTHAMLAGSPAIDQGKRDAIPSLALNTDQRGQPRPFDFPSITNAPGGDGSDIGAFEANQPLLSIVASGTNVVLWWPAAGPVFQLESVTNLAASNNWSVVGGTPAEIGNQFYLTNSGKAPRKFYRLIYP